ncbi:MAG: site-specific DNA-methyltransferase [Pseudomonadota bacterium]
MKTVHQFSIGDARKSKHIPPKSVDIVVTSPPYPMIQMWDDVFAAQDNDIQKALDNRDGMLAFERMNRLLDRVWDEVYRVLKFGGLACINIGDAVRTINDHFMLYPNHSRILTKMLSIGFTPLPAIIWRKQTNAPNKFMGSGMLPAGAYVTLEHEYVLILRKGGKREFQHEEEKQHRRKSAIFWEERNQWFSDVWMDLKGTVQKLDKQDVRNRSGAFPFELPYRLICMYSTQGDLVFDPFLGMGTTMLAAMASGRNSIGIEMDKHFYDPIVSRMETALEISNTRIAGRLENHLAFVSGRISSGKPVKHVNTHYGFPVMTAQEKNLMIHSVESIRQTGDHAFEAVYSDRPQDEFCRTWPENSMIPDPLPGKQKPSKKTPVRKPIQLELL